MTAYWCELAWLPPGRVAAGVRVSVAGDRIADVVEGAPPADADRLAGLVLPGVANAHSHAFHRALRGRAEHGAGSFWTWRQQMYTLAGSLDPARYRALARAAYVEMALAGVTAVGEFHYLHHRPDGRAYPDPNAMATAVIDAAREAGLRITLLDTCYLAGGFGEPPAPEQQRFADRDAAGWAARAGELAARYRGAADADVVVGAAVHSVRAVPAAAMPAVAEWAANRSAPLHVHVSEQRAENAACRQATGLTPTALLSEHGVLGPRTTAVHATHVTDADVALLGGTRTTVCLCPTTERALGDGIGPGRALADAGCPLALGSDSHATIDLLGEAAAVEMHERLAGERRGAFNPAELLGAATAAGHACLGFPDAGVLSPGAWADLVTVRLDSPRTAGVPADAIVFAATAADVTDVVASGRRIVRAGRHVRGDVAALLAEAGEAS